VVNNQFDIEVLQSLITVMQDEDKIVRDLAKQALEKLNYNFEQG
jgi:HEAT repeat protein